MTTRSRRKEKPAPDVVPCDINDGRCVGFVVIGACRAPGCDWKTARCGFHDADNVKRRLGGHQRKHYAKKRRAKEEDWPGPPSAMRRCLLPQCGGLVRVGREAQHLEDVHPDIRLFSPPLPQAPERAVKSSASDEDEEPEDDEDPDEV